MPGHGAAEAADAGAEELVGSLVVLNEDGTRPAKRRLPESIPLGWVGQCLVDPVRLGLNRLRLPFADKSTARLPLNALVKHSREVLIVVPWNDRMGGNGCVLAHLDDSYTTVLWHHSIPGRR
jgi:hypothetical protein